VTQPRSRDARIARIASAQHGLATTAQLRACGLADTSIAKRVAAGRLFRIHRGVYAVGHASLSRDAQWMAAVLAAGEGAVLSHLAAAVHWRMWRRSGSVETTVTCPRRVRGLLGVNVVTSGTLLRRDRARRFDIPVTSVARTIVDLGDVLTAWQLANVMHEAEFRGRWSERAVREVLRRTRGRRAVSVVRRAFEIRAGGSIGTMSELEDDFLRRAHARGLEPAVGVEVLLPDGSLRPDFVWRELRLVIETDAGNHDRIRSRREDLGRDARYRAGGYDVLRIRREAFDAALDEIEARLRAAAVLV
jgi:very-short-patch-repair endonuclease